MTQPVLYFDVGSPFAHLAAERAARVLALREATDAAHGRGVFGVPTVAVRNVLFWGDDRLDEAAAALALR